MAEYFVALQVTGFIGLLGTALNALYFFALGLLLNIIIQRTRGNDLRLRIAGTSSFFSLVSELRGADDNIHTDRYLIIVGLLILVLAGNAISFIVNTGVKATTSGIARYPTATWHFGYDTPVSAEYNPGHIVQSRYNSSELLTNLFLYSKSKMPDRDASYSGADFAIVSESTPVPVVGVNSNYDTALPFINPVPGTVSLTRLLYSFTNNTTPACDPTTPNCELTSMRTTLAPWADPSYLFDPPWKVVYNNHGGKPITIANISSPIGTGNAYRKSYVVERPTTYISGYTEDNGISVMAAITTASFQDDFSTDQKYGLELFRFGASDTIQSNEILYNSIYHALNASIAAQLPQQNRTTASNNVILVYNTPSVTSDNSTHISCVLYEATVLKVNQPSQVKNMVSCREFHISVRSNTGATPIVTKGADYNENQDYAMLVIYNASSPAQITFGDGFNTLRAENITEIAKHSEFLLKNLTERMYPFMAISTGIVQPWEYKQGISIEKWSVIFIGTLLGVVVLMVVLERFMVDEVWRTDILTLIENSTTENPAVKPKKKWEKRHSEWSVMEENGSYRVLLRGGAICVEEEVARRLLKDRHS